MFFFYVCACQSNTTVPDGKHVQTPRAGVTILDHEFIQFCWGYFKKLVQLTNGQFLIRISLHPSTSLSRSACLSFSPSLYLPLSTSTCLSLSVYLSLSLFVYLCVSLSLPMYPPLSPSTSVPLTRLPLSPSTFLFLSLTSSATLSPSLSLILFSIYYF